MSFIQFSDNWPELKSIPYGPEFEVHSIWTWIWSSFHMDLNLKFIPYGPELKSIPYGPEFKTISYGPEFKTISYGPEFKSL